MNQCQSPSFSITAARDVVQDLFVPRRAIYWADFLVSVAIAYSAAWAFLNLPLPLPLAVCCYLMAGMALYRVSTFIHEVVHLKQGAVPGFKVVWNMVAGIPMLMPSFLYESHRSHHNITEYGTANDGEYLPLARSGWRGLVVYFLQIPVLPLFVFFRFTVLTPVSIIVPEWRPVIMERASSLVINLAYRRKLTLQAPSRWWLVVELLCCLRAWAILIMVGTGDAPWTRIPSLYALALLSLGLNHLRTLIAHRYTSDGGRMNHLEQMDDSFNVMGGVLSEPLFPVGTRYHALHHLFPTLPYHNLGIAHQLLIETFPEHSPYHAATVSGVRSAVHQFFAGFREASRYAVVN